jgi:hypothetical protein
MRNALLDFAQGASNAATSTVSGPVDLLSWLLERGGVPVGEPVGGSAWMARKGLTRQPTNALAGALGEAAGMSLPIAAAAKAPQIANALSTVGANASAPRMLGTQRGVAEVPYWHDPNKPPKLDQFGNVRDASRHGSAEWAGLDNPQRQAEGMANEMRRMLRADWSAKDFDPSGVRGVLMQWASEARVPPGVALREFQRQLSSDVDLPKSAKDAVLKAWAKEAGY